MILHRSRAAIDHYAWSVSVYQPLRPGLTSSETKLTEHGPIPGEWVSTRMSRLEVPPAGSGLYIRIRGLSVYSMPVNQGISSSMIVSLSLSA